MCEKGLLNAFLEAKQCCLSGNQYLRVCKATQGKIYQKQLCRVPSLLPSFYQYAMSVSAMA